MRDPRRPIRIGERFCVRQLSRRGWRWYYVYFRATPDGTAEWVGGVRPSTRTCDELGVIMSQRFCSERLPRVDEFFPKRPEPRPGDVVNPIFTATFEWTSFSRGPHGLPRESTQ